MKLEMNFISHRTRFFIIAAVMAIFAALVIGWLVVRADQQMRVDLLQQAQLVTKAVSIDKVRTLTGTSADLDNPVYVQVTDQLQAVTKVNMQWRWTYLMGRNKDGVVFFYLDSEALDSKDKSPPGEVYTEAPASFQRVFDSGHPAAEGPYADRWGVWVSALVPLTDPVTGAVVAVMGVDVEASAWKLDVASKAALPVGLILILLIGLAVAFFAARRVEASPKPVMRRLLPFLTVIVILMAAGTGKLLWQQHEQGLTANMQDIASDVAGDMDVALKQQSLGLSVAAKTIAADVRMQQALRDGNADDLLAAWGPLFATMRKENDLTHFYFFDKDRVCLLRVHKPEKRGDKIQRFTAREAERTGKTAYGIELGPLGTFTLRVVQPVVENGVCVGYVELGKEIEDVLHALHIRSGTQMAVIIRKEFLDRKTWEEGMRMLGREARWDHLSQGAIIYASQGRLPDVFTQIADHTSGELNKNIAFDGKLWRASIFPLQDVSGREVGDILVMMDISTQIAAFERLMVLGGVLGVTLLALILGIIYVLLLRTDAGIRAQQVDLDRSKLQLVQSDKLATLGEMATGLAHEINQPLGGISLVVTSLKRFMEKKILSDDRLQAGIRDIETSIQRMTRTIDHIRVYARQEVMAFDSVELAQTIDSALGLMGEQLRIHDIAVVKAFAPLLPRIKGEPHQLEQVWINFMANARDAMDEKQKMIEDGKLSAPNYRKRLEIALSHEPGANAVRVTFTDNGMGMTPEQSKKIFEPFFTTKEVGKGTGLGLSISHGIIDKHKGVIEVVSRRGEGTTFMISFPAEQILNV